MTIGIFQYNFLMYKLPAISINLIPHSEKSMNQNIVSNLSQNAAMDVIYRSNFHMVINDVWGS